MDFNIDCDSFNNQIGFYVNSKSTWFVFKFVPELLMMCPNLHEPNRECRLHSSSGSLLLYSCTSPPACVDYEEWKGCPSLSSYISSAPSVVKVFVLGIICKINCLIMNLHKGKSHTKLFYVEVQCGSPSWYILSLLGSSCCSARRDKQLSSRSGVWFLTLSSHTSLTWTDRRQNYYYRPLPAAQVQHTVTEGVHVS